MNRARRIARERGPTTRVHGDHAAAPPPAAAFYRSRPVVLWALAVMGLYGVLFAIAPTEQPILVPDTGGYLGVGRLLTGAGETPQQIGVFYSWAYGLLFTVPYALTTDIGWVYGWGVAVNCVAGAVLYLLLAGLLRRRYANAPVALTTTLAVAGATWSGVALQVGRIWPEIALAVLVAGWALALQRLVDGERRAPVELVALAVAVFATHHRMAGLVAVTAVVLLLRTSSRTRTLGLLALVGGCLATLGIDRLVQDAIYPEGPASFGFDGALDVPGTVARVLLGELWYVAAATAGLASAAFVRSRDARLPVLALAGAVLLTAVLGAAQLGAATERGVPLRSDFLTYGRYVSPFVPVLLALGATVLTLRRGRHVVVVLAVALGGLSLAEIAVNRSEESPAFVAFNAVGLLGSGLDFFPLDVVTPSLLALAAVLTLLAAVPRIRPGLGAGVLVGLAVLTSVTGAGRLSSIVAAADGAGRDIVTVVDRLPRDETVQVDPSGGSALFVLLQILRPERRFVYAPTTRSSNARFVVHGFRWTPPAGRPVTLLSAPGQFRSVSCLGTRCPRP